MAPLIGECRGVLQNQYRAGRGRETSRTGIEMPAQDIVFADAVLGEEPVSGLGRGPVLAGERDRLSHSGSRFFQQHSETPPQPGILEIALPDLLVEP
jgi:hypothetical protein